MQFDTVANYMVCGQQYLGKMLGNSGYVDHFDELRLFNDRLFDDQHFDDQHFEGHHFDQLHSTSTSKSTWRWPRMLARTWRKSLRIVVGQDKFGPLSEKF